MTAVVVAMVVVLLVSFVVISSFGSAEKPSEDETHLGDLLDP